MGSSRLKILQPGFINPAYRGLHMRISNKDTLTGLAGETGRETYALRRDNLREMLLKKGLDALLVSHPANRFYLSGFELHDPQPNESSGFLLVTAAGDDWLLTDSRYALAAEELWDKDRIYIYKNQDKATAELLSRHANLAGIESGSLSWQFARALNVFLGGKVVLRPSDGMVEQLRVIKDTSEIAALKRSFALNHKMFHWLGDEKIKNLASPLSEESLAWEIERLFREQGAQELAFSTIVAAGKKSARPHGIPGKEPVLAGDVLLVDAGCRVNNYCSDQTRTWWTGPEPSGEFARTMKLVRDAQEAAMSLIRPGVPCAEVYEAAKNVFDKAGVGNHFTHGLGHGVGLETHEAPRLSARSRERLEEGMTVTVEPGLYYPEWGGVRWENTVLVTSGGMEIL